MERDEDRLDCARCPFGRRCEQPPGAPLHVAEPGGQSVYTLTCCPRHWVNTHPLPLGEPFLLYRRLKDGLLPDPGGLLDQGALYLAVMDLIEALVAESEQRARQRQQAAAEQMRQPTQGVRHVCT